MAPDMSVVSFFQAFFRFTNLYGVSESIYCDKAKTFLGSRILFGHLSLFQEYEVKFSFKLKTIPVFFLVWGGFGSIVSNH